FRAVATIAGANTARNPLIVTEHLTPLSLFLFFQPYVDPRDLLSFPTRRSSDLRNGRSASLQRTFKKSFTSFSHSTRNKTRDGLIRVRNIRALNGRFNTSITLMRPSLVLFLVLWLKLVKDFL